MFQVIRKCSDSACWSSPSTTASILRMLASHSALSARRFAKSAAGARSQSGHSTRRVPRHSRHAAASAQKRAVVLPSPLQAQVVFTQARQSISPVSEQRVQAAQVRGGGGFDGAAADAGTCGARAQIANSHKIGRASCRERVSGERGGAAEEEET